MTGISGAITFPLFGRNVSDSTTPSNLPRKVLAEYLILEMACSEDNGITRDKDFESPEGILGLQKAAGERFFPVSPILGMGDMPWDVDQVQEISRISN